MITPTIGRRIWYWYCVGDAINHECESLDDFVPFDAGVVFVYADETVNLVVADHVGRQFSLLGVQIVEDRIRGCAQWMPYQVKQAEKETPPV